MWPLYKMVAGLDWPLLLELGLFLFQLGYIKDVGRVYFYEPLWVNWDTVHVLSLNNYDIKEFMSRAAWSGSMEKGMVTFWLEEGKIWGGSGPRGGRDWKSRTVPYSKPPLGPVTINTGVLGFPPAITSRDLSCPIEQGEAFLVKGKISLYFEETFSPVVLVREGMNCPRLNAWRGHP